MTNTKCLLRQKHQNHTFFYCSFCNTATVEASELIVCGKIITFLYFPTLGCYLYWIHFSVLLKIIWYKIKKNYIPRWALYLLGSYWDIRSFARDVFAYGYKISFSRGSLWVLLRNSTNWAADINLRFVVPPHLKMITLLLIW